MESNCPNCKSVFDEKRDNKYHCPGCGWFEFSNGEYKLCEEPEKLPEPEPIIEPEPEPEKEEPNPKPEPEKPKESSRGFLITFDDE